MPQQPPVQDAFEEALDHAFQRVRGALTEMIGSVDADINRPQDISRRFKINKNLAWKLSKLITISDPHAVLTNLPGTTGMNTIFDAFESGGAPRDTIKSARDRLVEFDRMVETHVGDRSTLQLVLASNKPGRVPTENLHNTRKMGYQCSSSIWGVQARVRMASFFLAPNPDNPELLDTASLGGLIDVRRLRSKATVPLMTRFAYNDDGTAMRPPEVEPIEIGSDDDQLMLMHEFCSKPVPRFTKISSGNTVRWQLAPGPVGNSGLNTWVYGECIRQFAPIYRDELNTYGEHLAPLNMPCEWCLCDIQIHRDLKFARDPRAILLSQIGVGPEPLGESDAFDDELPMAEEVESIGHCPPVASTPLIPGYSKMVNRVYQRMAWDANDFYGYRVTMKYPPMPTALMIRHDLADPK
ncbi:MAG: hypothetical protein KDA29_00325 [Phycisphaerales bacterium]|nr:hypothetical protein [Phycisphaerales bacterium]